MLKKFVKTTAIIGAVAATLGVTTPVDAASCGTVTANSLYVRSGASTSHNILGTVSKGNTVEIKDTQNGWHKISYNGDHGWVSGKYISSTSDSSTSESTSTGTTQTSKTGTITASSLNVRSGASTSYSILGTLSKGKVVTISAESNGWYKISYNGGYGWVSKTYVSTTGSTTSNGSTSGSTSTGTSQTVIKTGTITTSSLNVRSGASTSYSRIGSVTQGTKVSIYAESNGWYKISFNGGYGWVSKTYVSTGSTSTGSTTTGSTTTTNGYTVKRTLNVRAVAYTGGTMTALGTPVRYGVIAVDPSVIPYRSKVYIKELNKVFVAEDCGGGIKGNIIDIYMPTLSQCYSWGSRNITIQILG
ncbi:MAG: SH3 domain-containing protein [Intestinibacter bartlettii]|uniref:SH3 domain-containing protein n=1 Tax=Intestinibacter bartlettii TaxID=261299 RepID=UPI0026F2992F|nr:SH3 domain-containing protein [Intestinibacter bartlettii]MDO5011468.1 SH3 domain-containing protein [Intestinibacter bartlettii]